MVSVKVVSKSTGKPLRGERVAVAFDGLSRGVTSGYTDDEGDVHFDADPGTGTVHVNGSSRFNGRIAGRVVVYV